MTHEEILKQAKDALDKAIDQKKSNEMLLKSIGPAVIDALKPVLNQIKEAVSSIRVDVKPNIEVNPKVDMPRIPAPEVTVNIPDFPKIPVPIVNVSAPIVKVPELQWPKEKMPIEGWVQLMGVSLQNPLPVQIRDANGKPVDFGGSITQILGGGGGGKADFFTIKGFSQSAFADYLNSDGRLRVSVETGGSGLTDSELRASGVEVHQVSGSIWSVSVATQDFTFDTKQVSGAIDSVWVKGFDASVAASLVDSVGVQYSGSNPVPITVVSGALTSTVSVGDQLHDAADDGGAPVKVGGIARQANQTPVADGDRVSASFDDLGRQIVRHQVRDLTQSAYATLTTGTETTLLAGVASTFLDLMWIVGANNSDAAVSVDIRSGTAGSPLLTLRIPANGTAGISATSPIKQEIMAGTWTADIEDITGTTVTISALFSKEV